MSVYEHEGALSFFCFEILGNSGKGRRKHVNSLEGNFCLTPRWVQVEVN